MKLNIFYILLLTLFFASCAKDDPEVYPVDTLTDTEEDFEYLSLDKVTRSYVLPKMQDGQTLPLGAKIALFGAPKSQALSYTIEVVASSASVGSAILVETTGQIAANELISTLPISINLDAFEIGVPQTITLKIADSDAPIVDADEVTYTFTVICPSDIAGTYASLADGGIGDGSGGTASAYSGLATAITLTQQSDGVYQINDMSFGLYPQAYSDTAPPGVIQDICGTIVGTGSTDQYGDPFTINGSVDAGTGVITLTWSNTYGDSGSVTLTPQ